MNKIDYLQDYIKDGWSIFPCKRDKTPYTAHGFKDSSNDIDQIESWNDTWKECNWGLDLGKANLAVIDIDVRNGGYLKEEDNHYLIGSTVSGKKYSVPKTRLVKTGGGGFHLYYLGAKNLPKQLTDGIDFKSNSGYVIIPPSIHQSGSEYTWLNDLVLVPFPENILPKEEEKQKFSLPVTIAEGERNETLFKLGCSLRNKGFTELEITSALEIANNRCDTPIDNHELETIVKSVLKYEPTILPNDQRENSIQYNQEKEPKSFERFKLGKASDAFQPRPNIDWIIQNMVKTNSLNVWYGEYGHKKTFVALSAAVCVASGTKWLGQNTKQSNVLIIDEESGEHTLLDRLQAAIIGESQEEDLPIYFLSLSAFNFLKNENDIVYLKEYIELTESKLVIIDSFADVMSGGDENAVKDNVPVLIKLRKVCEETGAGIILLHHANANGGIRGSTSIGAALNSALKIQSEPKSTKIEITTKKMRDTEAFTKTAEIIFHNIPDKYGNKQLIDFYITEGEPAQFWEDESNTWENEIIEYMKSNNDEMITKDFLSNVSKDKHASYNKAIYSLRGKGIIQKSDKSTSRLAIWELLNEQ